MASLSLKHIYKVYDGKVKAVNDFCMEIEDKEFIVFVGPSGCGKSTTLRMIAGLEEITAGELMIGDEVVNDVEPKDRNIAMVFQNYALYPHMTVRENMAFALKLKKDMSKEEIDARVDEAARILDITPYLDRKPRALSGGQRQRVSLGRAIVRDPKVFLLDEPLSNLDAKLRAQMRTEITKLHHKLQTTFIYVTHDQVEAMTMGTRIVVMKLGVVQQIDTPSNLYRYPGNKFVAGFIGTPQMNFFDATLAKRDDGSVELTFANDRKLLIPEECVVKAESKYFDGKTVVSFGIRPEDIHFDSDFVKAHPDTSITIKTSIIEALGSESIVYCELDDTNADAVTESATRMVLKVDPKIELNIGDTITVAIDPERIHLFDTDTELSIMPRIPTQNVGMAAVKEGKLEVFGESLTLPPSIADIEDGEYNVRIPSDAFIFENAPCDVAEIAESKTTYSHIPPSGKYVKKALANVVESYPIEDYKVPDRQLFSPFKAKVAAIENIAGVKLLRLIVNGNTVFAIGNSSIDEKAKELTVAIDWKRVSLTSENREVKSLKEENVLCGKLVKEAVSSQEYNFALALAGKNIYCTDYIKEKLFNAAGRKVFDITLACGFDIYNVKIAENGIDAEVVDVLDYGDEKIAVCKVEEEVVNVSLKEEASKGDKVKLAINLPCIGIVEADRGIRVI